MRTLFKLVCAVTAFISTLCQLTPFQEELKRFLPTQLHLNRNLRKYLNEEVIRIQRIKDILLRYDTLYKKAEKNETGFLSNPLYGYLLMKFLTSDLRALSNLVSDNRNLEDFFVSLNNTVVFPSDEDLLQASNSFIWYQATKVDEKEIEEMVLPEFKLTVEDCKDLGLKAYNIANYKGVIYWMGKALKILGENGKNSPIGLSCMEYIAYAKTIEGDTIGALALTRELFELMPNNTRAKANVEYLEDVLAQNKKEEYLNGEHDLVQYVGFTENLKDYTKLCRGESTQPASKQSKLTCQLITNGNPYLLLQPAREEEMNLSPRIVVYHNVISDSEIELLQSLSLPKLEPGEVQRNPEDIRVEVRISKVGWLKDSEHEIVAKISQRIGDITGLSTETAEEMQVANYGIGGYYRLHPDFSSPEDELEEPEIDGNRIATWLSYINHVEEGGYTVFPLIGAIIKPEKGSAVLWYNLFRNGSVNYDTVHAGCPVLSGTKWIANKWFHEAGQEFRKPCNLDRWK